MNSYSATRSSSEALLTVNPIEPRIPDKGLDLACLWVECENGILFGCQEVDATIGSTVESIRLTSLLSQVFDSKGSS